MSVEVAFETPEQIEAKLARYEEMFRHRYTERDEGYRQAMQNAHRYTQQRSVSRDSVGVHVYRTISPSHPAPPPPPGAAPRAPPPPAPPPAAPGLFAPRPAPHARDYTQRAFTVGIGGPVGSGKTALLLALCRRLRNRYSLAVVTNDIFTKEDGEFLVRHEALETRRITAVETGGCPHTAVRDDVSQNLDALGQLMVRVQPELLFVESGGDNLAAQFSRDLADFTIYVIDVSGGDKIPRKGGPGITQSDLLVINKTDLAALVGADLDVMARDSRRMRGDGPFVFAQVTNGVGVDTITDAVVAGLEATRAAAS